MIQFEAGFVQDLVKSGKKKTVVTTFNSKYRYIDDVSFLDNPKFEYHVNAISPNELKIKYTTNFSSSTSYLGLFLKYDDHVRLHVFVCQT